MMDMDDDEPGPSRKFLKQKIYEMKTDRRSGAYTSDPNNPQRGIFKDPNKQNQKEYRRKLTDKIKEVRQQMRGT